MTELKHSCGKYWEVLMLIENELERLERARRKCPRCKALRKEYIKAV